MQTESEFSHYPKCQTMMRRIEKNNSFRLKSAVLLLLLNFPAAIIPLAFQYGLFFTIFALLYTAMLLFSFVFAVPETPRLCAVPAVLILLGLISTWISFFCGIPMLLLLIWVIPDYQKLKWLKTQSGYPQFSERFDEQMQRFGKDYQPEHDFNHVQEAEMKDAFEESPAQEAPSSAQIIEMPDIPEIPERTDFHE